MNDGRKKKTQKHQNKTAFKIQFDPLAQEIHKKVSFKGLCKRCADQLQWKIQYNKYKKMTEAAKCTFCHNKNVFRSYMRACDPCWQSKNVCPKCLEAENEEQTQTRLNEIEQKKEDVAAEKKMNDFLKTLKERSRRTVKRQYEKGTIHWDNQLQNFVDDDGNTLPLQFRHGFGNNHDQDEQEDGDDIEDEFVDEEGNMSDIDSDEEEIQRPLKVEKKKQERKVENKKEEDLDEEDDEDIGVQVQPHDVQKDKENQSEKKATIEKVTATVDKQDEEVQQHPELEAKYEENGGQWQDIEEDTEDLQRKAQTPAVQTHKKNKH